MDDILKVDKLPPSSTSERGIPLDLLLYISKILQDPLAPLHPFGWSLLEVVG